MEAKINEIIPSEMPELVQELIEHYKIDKSFMGFLMTLNTEEIHLLQDKLETPTDLYSVIPIIVHYKGIPEEGTVITHKALTETLGACLSDLNLIEMYKDGKLNAVPSPDGDDNEWVFSLTEKGREEAKKMLGIKDLEK